ncbi:hypothetical protein PTSG_04580 [Salpingoeca rosetta]|uniref:peptide chain release factor N(5)-glutamine methyltransferase n=1 Tax=Salpingoeca rosetta (strain ATCC 50818 / BSB-021) TaxID=946362 RepID=F2U7U7_SALR5|nr:uncharacterized protein PTSG_04580 [Salpingoeca rosetta]EGD72852.1 hypothetical protein PTSG_04580 [Salpingoeca rosetta]|eukprot:XP_004994675.1 hypothetical protein PTSG_04580 [Salpingoeca rosetta]
MRGRDLLHAVRRVLLGSSSSSSRHAGSAGSGLTVEEVSVAAREIVYHVLGTRASSSCEMEVTPEQQERAHSLAHRRACREPLQYVLGEWDFRDQTLTMRSPVLIPRPETEVLVDLIQRKLRQQHGLHFLEIGVGSGAISLSLLHENPSWTATGIDLDDAAIQLTQHNASRCGVADRLTLHKQDITTATPSSPCFSSGPFDFVVSNPPYIRRDEMPKLAPELRYENDMALCGGEDGLDVTRAILDIAPHIISRTGGARQLWLELSPPQCSAVARLVPPGCVLHVHLDQYGHERFVQVNLWDG